MSYFQNNHRQKSIPLVSGIFLILLSAIGATFAANISINESNRIEFGQGIYVVQACNGWIQISLNYGAVNENGDSYITSFAINGLDTRACTSTNIVFKAFGSDPAPMNLYSRFAFDDLDQLNPISENQFTIRVDEQEQVSLVDFEGTTIATDDPDISLDIEGQTKTYVVGFTNPLITVAQLSRITVESGPNL